MPEQRSEPGVILCSAGLPEPVSERLARYGPVEVVADDEAALLARAGAAIGIAARASMQVTSAVIDAAPLLRVIGRSGVGVDNVDVAAASRRGIPVVVTPQATTSTVAEGAIALVLALAKRLPELDDVVSGGQWQRRDSMDLLDIAGSRLGVVGLGRVGRRVAELAAALGFDVVAHEPAPSPGLPDDLELLDLPTLVGRCDVVVLTAALTSTSRGMVGPDLLSRFARGAILVNVSRGELVSSLDDLYAALGNGALRGIGLDVFASEPPDPAHPLLHDRRVIATPHILALTRHGRAAIFDQMAAGMAAVLQGDRAESVADPSMYIPLGSR